MKKYLKILISVVFIVMALLACSGSDMAESKSMEQIQKEDGIPVVVQPVSPQKFVKHLTFFGQFSGFKETTVGAMIGGRIEKINVRSGSKVRENQVIIEFPEDAPASQYQQAKSAYLNSKKTYKRMKAMHEKGEIAQADFDGITTKFDVDKRNYETMKDMLKLDAPYDGVLTEVMVHEGDNVKHETALFTIAQLNKMKIRIWLSDSERMEIKKGMKTLATVAGKTYSGTVYDLSMSVDPIKQAFYADLVFENPTGEILPGLTADVKVILYENDQAIVIPRNLLKKDDSGTFVCLADGENVRKQIITIKNESGVVYEIGSGLQIGDPLIVKGSARLSDGAKIKVVK